MDYVLVALLPWLAGGVEDVDVDWSGAFLEVLLCVFDDAVGAEGHEAVLLFAKVGEDL